MRRSNRYIAPSLLTLDFSSGVNGDDVTCIVTQYHVPDTVKIDQLGRGVIERYSAHLAHGLRFQSVAIHNFVSVVLGAVRNELFNILNGA
jgi:hypothetical protein